MSQTSTISTTLSHITYRKLANLKQQASIFARQCEHIHSVAGTQGASIIDSTLALITAIEDAHLGDKVAAHSASASSLSLMKILLTQAIRDSSISEARVLSWKQDIETSLETIARQYEHATFFGDLVLEWIQDAKVKVCAASKGILEEATGDSFEQLSHGQMYEQQAEWEKRALHQAKVDISAIETYLDNVFADAKVSPKKSHPGESQSPMEALRKSLADFGTASQQLVIDKDGVAVCIEGILSQDLYDGARRESLADLKSHPSILQELADVLNQDLLMLQDWHWESEPLRLNVRRAVNAKYRVYMDEEFHQAILLHFIGLRWAIYLKKQFKRFAANCWTHSPHQSISREELKRVSDMVPGTATPFSGSVSAQRRMDFLGKYWLAHLPTDMSTLSTGNALYSDDNDEEDYVHANKGRIKQDVLRLVTTEMILAQVHYGQFTVVQSDFEWFGPSLPHSTILTVLRYLGMSEVWLQFLAKFLQPLVMFAHEPEQSQGRKRSCGIPMSHLLSTTIGEAVLFCLDTAVNQVTKGYLYRVHDDLWYWGQKEKCVAAWNEMSKFATVMGLQLNKDKTGSASIDTTLSSSKEDGKLPVGPVRWGFLRLNSETGKWVEDDDSLISHVADFEKQLMAIPSVLGRVRAWNAYVDKFVANNLGDACICLGKEHALLRLVAFAKVQDTLFAKDGHHGTRPSIASFIGDIIDIRFGRNDFPEGFFYFPTGVGGLGIRNPAISSAAILPNQQKSPMELVEAAIEADEVAYEQAQERWESRSAKYGQQKEPFLSLQELLRYPEETSANLSKAYRKLQEDSVAVEAPKASLVRFTAKDDSVSSFYASKKDLNINGYWQYILHVYGDDVVDRFGRLELAEPGHLPLGAIDMLSSEKVRWQN